jgi:hypothetical protein
MNFCALVRLVNNPRTQDLAEASDNIVSMMLRMTRVHGLRCLNHLVMSWLIFLEIGRVLKQFRDLLAAFKAGTLVLPTPAPSIAPQPRQAAPARPAAAARPAAPRHRRPPQPAPANRVRACVSAPRAYAPQPLAAPPSIARVRAPAPQKMLGLPLRLCTPISLRYRNKKAEALPSSGDRHQARFRFNQEPGPRQEIRPKAAPIPATAAPPAPRHARALHNNSRRAQGFRPRPALIHDPGGEP